MIKIRKLKYTMAEKILDNDPELIKLSLETIGNRFKESLEEKSLLWLEEPKIEVDPFHFYSYCTFPECKNNDVDECSEQHPSYIETVGPYILVYASARAIPKRHEKYLDIVKRSHGSIVYIEEM